jgi:Fe-S-cluster containining protein
MRRASGGGQSAIVNPQSAIRNPQSSIRNRQSAIRNILSLVAVHVLAFHAGYRCRHSGVCCTSGWTIPVEAPLHHTLDAAIAWGHLRVENQATSRNLLEPAGEMPHGETAILRHKPDGSCVFFEPARGNLCAIQRQIDHDHLPSACRHSPRVVVRDPRGTFITLSHVCPTAARMLIAGGSAEVVTGAPGFDEHIIWEGLDARDALPPLVQPGVLWDWDAWDLWERSAPARLAAGESPEQALARLEDAVARVARWRPGEVPLIDEVEAALSDSAPRRDPRFDASLLLDLERLAWQSVRCDTPNGHERVALTSGQLDVPGWEAWQGVVGRYLAARAFAGWIGYYGSGLITWYRSVLTAYAVLRVACSRAAVAANRSLDEPMMVGALGEADHLLMHLASAADLAAALDAWEPSS